MSKLIARYPEMETDSGNWNILVPLGKENKLMIPLLAASEKGKGQTESAFEKKREMWLALIPKSMNQSALEWAALESDSLVDQVDMELPKE